MFLKTMFILFLIRIVNITMYLVMSEANLDLI